MTSAEAINKFIDYLSDKIPTSDQEVGMVRSVCKVKR